MAETPVTEKIRCLKFANLDEGSHTWFERKRKDGQSHGAIAHAHPNQVIPVDEFNDPQQYVNNGMAIVVEVDDAIGTASPDDTVPKMPPTTNSSI